MILSRLLNRKVKGFNGVTHLLIGFLIFSIVILVSRFEVPFINTYLIFTSGNIFNIVLAFLIISGGSLFPDLDSNRSTAQFRLGGAGRIINSFMITSGTIIWNLYHFRRDKRISYMHRAIWHTPFIVVIFSIVFIKYIPESDQVFMDSLYQTSVSDLHIFAIENIVPLLAIYISYLFIRLSIATITYKTFKKIFKKQHISDMAALIITIPFVFGIAKMTYSDIRMVSITIIIGYSSHLLGDLFTRGSIPLLYPIPIKREAYYRPNFPFQISTNEGPSKITNKVIVILIAIILLSSLYISKDYIVYMIK